MALAAAANKVEFAVIDAKLIEGCLLKARAEAAEEKRSDEWGAVRDFDEPIQPHMATELALSFCSLKSIDNLMVNTKQGAAVQQQRGGGKAGVVCTVVDLPTLPTMMVTRQCVHGTDHEELEEAVLGQQCDRRDQKLGPLGAPRVAGLVL